MARKFGPFNDSLFYELENRRLQRALNPYTGFVASPQSGQGLVTAGSGAQLVIAPFADGALIDGMYVENPTSETVTLTTNTGSTSPRIDRLVMRLDMTAKTMAPFQIVGTPGSSPVAPSLVRTATVFDMPLCRYQFPGSGTAQNPSGLVDERAYAVESATALTPYSAAWITDPTSTYGPGEAYLLPTDKVELSGLFRRAQSALLPGGQTAEANTFFGFTGPLPLYLRPRGPRILGTASTSSGSADVYYLTDATSVSAAFGLAYVFRQNTTVYQQPDWFINLNGLSYRK